MKPISKSEASRLTLEELNGLFRRAFNALANAERGSEEYRSALATLIAVEDEIAARLI